MSMRAWVGGCIRPWSRYRTLALGGLMLSLMMTGSPHMATAASYEVIRGEADIGGTHNVVYINYDFDNNRYRAHCVSVGNRGVFKEIFSCRLYEHPSGQYRTGAGTEPSFENRHTSSELLGDRPGQCYWAEMGLRLNAYQFTIPTIGYYCRVHPQ
jgi:hypothetical protein